MKKNYLTLFNLAASAILFIFSFPGYGADFLVWFSLVPLFFVISQKRDKKFTKGLIAGIIIYTGSLIWLAPTISTFGGLPFISAVTAILLLGTYLGIYTAILSILFPDTEKKPVLSLFLIPAIWTGLDFMVSFLFTGFPWVFPAYSQFKNTLLIQITSLTGPYGLTFYILMVNTGLFLIIKTYKEKKEIFSPGNLKTAGIMVFFTILIFSYSFYSLNTAREIIKNSPKSKILLLQANIPPDEKHSQNRLLDTLKKYFSMTSSKLNEYDLAVWPETALPFPVFASDNILKALKNNARENGNQLIGTLDIKSLERTYLMKNRAVLFTKKGKASQTYDKIHLVPFGEYIPLKDYFPFLSKFIVPAGEFVSGENNNTITLENLKIGTKICFEIIFPDLVREQVKNGANIIINMTNDAWFGKTAGPYQHLAISVFRAVENRRSVARCANTGISAHILPTGEIKTISKIFETKSLNYSLPLVKEKTFYTEFGDYFGYLCMIMVLFQGFFHYHDFRKNKYKKEN